MAVVRLEPISLVRDKCIMGFNYYTCTTPHYDNLPVPNIYIR